VNRRRTGTHADFPRTSLIYQESSTPGRIPIGADRGPSQGKDGAPIQRVIREAEWVPIGR
jgi:hypothetical protein